MQGNGPDSADVAKVRRIGAVRLARLETALADAVLREKSAQGAVGFAERAQDAAIATANDARRDASRAPVCETTRLWCTVCMERGIAAGQNLADARANLAEATIHRTTCAAAVMRHKSRDDALANHGAHLARGERRLAEIKGEDDQPNSTAMGAFALLGGPA